MENKLKWCFGIKEGLRIVEPNERLTKSYLDEAKSSLERAEKNFKDGDLLWATVVTYYADYYALYSFLQKIGIKCENHSCSINAVKFLLGEDKIKLIDRHKDKRIDEAGFVYATQTEDFDERGCWYRSTFEGRTFGGEREDAVVVTDYECSFYFDGIPGMDGRLIARKSEDTTERFFYNGVVVDNGEYPYYIEDGQLAAVETDSRWFDGPQMSLYDFSINGLERVTYENGYVNFVRNGWGMINGVEGIGTYDIGPVFNGSFDFLPTMKEIEGDSDKGIPGYMAKLEMGSFGHRLANDREGYLENQAASSVLRSIVRDDMFGVNRHVLDHFHSERAIAFLDCLDTYLFDDFSNEDDYFLGDFEGVHRFCFFESGKTYGMVPEETCEGLELFEDAANRLFPADVIVATGLGQIIDDFGEDCE
tara:strand:- start:922 stop:2181 length:1260 start_codon:yes stop_codon:yes gene_type:complete